jgi:hypothetical protein
MTDASGRSTATNIVDYTLNPAMQKQGKLNHIMLIAKGPLLSCIVNGQLLQAITYHSYTNGSVALFVSNLPQSRPGAAAQFSNLTSYLAQ